MKTIQIEHNGEMYDILLDDEDYDKVKYHKWYIHHGYAETLINRKPVQMHRMLMGRWKHDNVIVDHKDNVRTNNQKYNLRCCNRFQNQQNRKTNKGNTLPKGIRVLPNGRYNVRVQAYGVRRGGGTFESLEEALNKRNEIAQELHGEYFNPAHPIEVLNEQTI